MSVKKNKKAIENRRINRRQFLVGTGSTFLMLPPLMSLMPREVRAQVMNQNITRSVIYMGGLGINRQLMYPNSPVSGLTTFTGSPDLRYRLLEDIPGDLSFVLDRANFAALYPYMNVLHGMSMTGGNYQGHSHTVLAGTHSQARNPTFGKTIDAILEDSTNVYNSTSTVPIKALRIANSIGGEMSWRIVNGSRTNNRGLIGDTNVFNTLFASLSTTPQNAKTRDEINREQIVDKVFTDLKSLENDKRLSKSDKTLLDRWVSGVNDLQKRLAGSGPTCARPSMTLYASGNGNPYQFPWTDSNWGDPNAGQVFDNYVEMIKLAFECDLTRVVYISNSLWRDRPDGRTGGLHHECPSDVESAIRQKWGLLKMRDLATALRNTSDPLNSSGNILDNSTILFTNELGDWTTGHSISNMPCITFGRGGGAMKSGYYVDSRQTRNLASFLGDPGRPFKQILQTIMKSMGVTQQEYSQFGRNGFGEFIPGVQQFGKNVADVYLPYANEHNDPMPFITNV